MRTSTTLAVAALSSIAFPTLYLLYVRRDLSRKIHHEAQRGKLSPSITDAVKSIPDEAIAEECPMVYECAWKAVSTSLLPDIAREKLLVQYLQRNMTKFSASPQAFAIKRMCSPQVLKTFERTYIESLGFLEASLVCGVYQVQLRGEDRIELSMETHMPFSGRLVVTVEERDGRTVFGNHVVQWKQPGEKASMPLEGTVATWIHQFFVWWLLDSGTKHFINLKKS
ncbi:hypothetical protein M501DRAFT_1002781 [Patellaria atrata CBS 101060]|uniref:Uncharacterized protein n=1 Tax=Patellaria atrata CBS 101060 TaxID=1346257 RepID=A0A9P4SEM9_9PEZI|nr:hypothetical protein M501DRAFT_1002781 [Patellaria atrata CBS 101060]